MSFCSKVTVEKSLPNFTKPLPFPNFPTLTHIYKSERRPHEANLEVWYSVQG